MRSVVLTACWMSKSSQSGRQSQSDPEAFLISSKKSWATVALKILFSDPSNPLSVDQWHCPSNYYHDHLLLSIILCSVVKFPTHIPAYLLWFLSGSWQVPAIHFNQDRSRSNTMGGSQLLTELFWSHTQVDSYFVSTFWMKENIRNHHIIDLLFYWMKDASWNLSRMHYGLSNGNREFQNL